MAVDFQINVVVETRQATQGVERVNQSLTSIERSLIRIQSLVGAAFAFQALASGVRAIFNLSDSLTNAENRLKSLGFEGQRNVDIVSKLFQVANETRVGFDDVAETFARSSQALKLLGASEQEAIDFTRTLTQAVAISGSTTAEAEGALRQFTQGLGRGQLRGQELISVLEQLPIVADIIAKRLGVSRFELNKLAEQGKITGDVIRSAFAEARDEIAERFARTIPTIAQSFVVLRNELIRVGGGFLQASGASEGFARAILAVADNLDLLGRVLGGVVIGGLLTLAGPVLGAVIRGFQALTLVILRNPFVALGVAVAQGIGFLVTFADQIKVTNDGVASLADFAQAAIDRFRGVFEAGFNAVINLINQFIPSFDAINFSVEDGIRAVAQALDVLYAVFQAAFAGISEIFQNFGPVVQDAFTQGLNGLIDIVEDFLNLLVTGFFQIDDILKEAAAEAVLGFARIFDIGFDDIVAFVADLGRRIKNGLANLFTVGVEAGASLIEGITNSVDQAVNTEGDQIVISLGRLENPAKGAMAQVGDTAGQALNDALGQAPVSNTVDQLLEDARKIGTAKAAQVGDNVGSELGAGVSEAVLREKGALEDALNGLVASFSRFADLSKQEFQNLADNLGTILGGADLSAAFEGLVQNVAALAGVAGSELTNALGGVFAILDELGFKFEDVFGKQAATAIRLLGAVTSEQFQGMLAVGRQVFSGIDALLGGLGTSLGQLLGQLASAIAGWFGYGTAATTANAAATAGATATTAATAASGVAATGATGAFATFGTVVSTVFSGLITFITTLASTIVVVIQTILVGVSTAVAQAAVIIASALSSVITLISGAVATAILEIGFAIAAVGQAALAAAPGLLVISVVLLAIAAVVAAIALLVIAIKELIEVLLEAIQVFADMFGFAEGGFLDLGGIAESFFQGVAAAAQAMGQVVTAIFQALGAAISAIFQAIGAAISAVFNAVGAAAQALGQAIAAVFQALGAAISAVFNAIGAAAQALAQAMTAIFNAFGAAVSAVFNALGAAISAIFKAIGAAAQALTSAMSAAFSALGNAVANIFSNMLSAGVKAFSSIVSAGAKLVGSLVKFFGDLLVSVTKVFSAILTTGAKAIEALAKALRAIVKLIREIIKLAGEAKDAIGGIGGGLPGFGGGGGGGGFPIKLPKIKVPFFAEGGVIDGPTELHHPDVAGKKFARGGPIPPFTLLGGASTITPTSDLGIAGEAGPEAILPLAPTSRGLGVTAVIPDDLLQRFAAMVSRTSGQGGQGQVTVVNKKTIIIETSNAKIDDVRRLALEVDGSVESRIDASLADVLAELAA